jgi:hypothetical protein
VEKLLQKLEQSQARQFSSDSEESAEEQCKHKYKKGVKKDGKKGAFSDSEESDEEQFIRKICVDSDLDMDFDEDNLPDELLDDETVSVGDFVLVRFSTKKKVLYFVGHVQELLDCDEYLVKFLRRRKNYGFCYPAVDDISSIPRKEIIAKLPKPQEIKGTARQASYIKFSVSFSNYDVQ